MAEEGDLHEMSFLWENQSWGLFDSDNSDKGKDKLVMKPPMNREEKEERNEEGDKSLNKKQSQGIGPSRSGGGKKKIDDGEGKGKGRESDHEVHIWTERERRKKMRNMFSSLHALLPELPSKADKSTVVDEAVKYIKDLQQTLEKLEKQKLERLKSVSTTVGYDPTVMNSQWHPYDSREAFIADQGSSNNLAIISSAMAASNPSTSIPVPPRLPIAFQTFTSPNVVLNICGEYEAQYCIYAAKKPALLTTICFVMEKHKIEAMFTSIFSNGNGINCMILAHANGASHQFPEANSVEETFKQAAREIMLWIS